MKLSITRALSELKLLDKRIQKETSGIDFITSVQKKKKIKGNISKEEYTKQTQGNYVSLISLIERRKKIKSAIVNSNSLAKVSIAGKEMTVAEAIERKTSIEYEKNILAKMKLQFAKATKDLEANNNFVKEKLDKLLESNFGKDLKVSDSDVDAISKPYLEQNEWELIDPLNILNKIDSLEKSIDEFEHEVDFVLSESNTINQIDIE